MYTTNRCMTIPAPSPSAIKNIATCALLTCASALFSLNSWAQTREFPAAALRGSLEVTVPPQVVLDGKLDQLSPGARIHGTNNMLLLSGALVGQKVKVNYIREINGALSEVWVLTEAEAAVKRPTANPSRFFTFFD